MASAVTGRPSSARQPSGAAPGTRCRRRRSGCSPARSPVGSPRRTPRIRQPESPRERVLARNLVLQAQEHPEQTLPVHRETRKVAAALRSGSRRPQRHRCTNRSNAIPLGGIWSSAAVSDWEIRSRSLPRSRARRPPRTDRKKGPPGSGPRSWGGMKKVRRDTQRRTMPETPTSPASIAALSMSRPRASSS